MTSNDENKVVWAVGHVIGRFGRLAIFLYLWHFVGAPWSVLFGISGGTILLAGLIGAMIFLALRR